MNNFKQYEDGIRWTGIAIETDSRKYWIIETLFFGCKDKSEFNNLSEMDMEERIHYLKSNDIKITEKTNKPAFYDVNYKRRSHFKTGELILDEDYFEGYTKILSYDSRKGVILTITPEFVLLRNI